MNDAVESGEASLRTFVALPVPGGVQKALAPALERLRHAVPGKSVRWVPLENVHLTLRFIGNIRRADLEPLKRALQDAVRGIEPIVLRWAGLGGFPNARSPRVLWVGLQGDLERLARLQVQVVNATAAWGRIEERGFHPHLTLGRVQAARPREMQQIADALGTLSVPACPPWRAEHIHLMESVLAPGGSEYSKLARFDLAAGERALE